MQAVQTSLLARDDTFFGVCEAIGEDFGFNPFFLRVTLGVLLLWNPVVVVGGYAAAGIVVALTRWLVPNPRMPALPAWQPEPLEAGYEAEQHPLPLAA